MLVLCLMNGGLHVYNSLVRTIFIFIIIIFIIGLIICMLYNAPLFVHLSLNPVKHIMEFVFEQVAWDFRKFRNQLVRCFF